MGLELRSLEDEGEDVGFRVVIIETIFGIMRGNAEAH